MDDAVAANLTFNKLVQGFLGLGLLVGVAALGVISARAVVERRQQIGVMRAIGFRTGMVQAAFLLESSFVALTSIFVGTALGLLLSWNIIRDQQAQPSWENLELVVPWLNLARDLPRRLRRRARGDARARAARVADPPGRSTQVSVTSGASIAAPRRLAARRLAGRRPDGRRRIVSRDRLGLRDRDGLAVVRDLERLAVDDRVGRRRPSSPRP